MTARLPADLLTRSAEEGARLVALSHLEEIGRAERRLADSQDFEALHDFRVGLRRLRSCMRAYRAPLKGSVSKKVRRRLRDLTLSTNANRDTEVQLGWLRQRAGQLGPGEVEGLAWLIGRLEGRQHGVRAKALSRVGGRFLKAAAKLRPRLQTIRLVVQTGRGQPPASFSLVTGELICEHVEQLAKHLSEITGPAETKEIHSARIAAKRLRYLLEPLSRRAPGAKSLIRRLKGLQDMLGDLHDMQVLSEEIASSLAALVKAVPPPGAVAGLMALERLAAQQSSLSFATFETHWGRGRATEFLDRAARLGMTLSHPPEDGTGGAPDEATSLRARRLELHA
jgi:CHAD domain-containing protein